MDDENNNNKNKNKNKPGPKFDPDILKVLKSQSEAMMNMNERISELEIITTRQQEIINQLSETTDINNDKN